MTDQILSPDEVDALLDGVTNEDTEPVIATPVDGVREYQIGRTERAIRSRISALVLINERLVTMMRAGLLDYTSRHALIESSPTEILTYDEFLNRLPLPSSINVLSIRPLRGNAMLVCEPSVIFAIIDTLFGGSGRLPERIQDRSFSPTEQRIVRRIVDLVCNAATQAWAEVYPLEFSHVRTESQLQFAAITRPLDTVLVTTIKVGIGQGGGRLHLCVPYAMLEPIRGVLSSPVPETLSPAASPWTEKLTRHLQSAEVEVVADLGHAPASIADLLSLRVGDFIELDLNQTLTARIDNMPVFTCRYGTSNDRYAIRIESFLSTPHEIDARVNHDHR